MARAMLSITFAALNKLKPSMKHSSLRCAVWCLFYLCMHGAQATIGFAELPATDSAGLVSVFYPTDSPAKREQHGPFQFELAIDAPPLKGNRRLIIISPGSGASPWVYFDLTQELVNDGFVVAMPEHSGDNYKDNSAPGPASWKLRPIEVSRSIDRIAADPRFQALLDFSRVGMYGMSAGGHTALTLAGGKWSPRRLKQHCDEHIAEDFQACAGLNTQLTGGFMDGIKRALVKRINDLKLDDDTWFGHTDPRIAAIVAGVPFAADFDPESLHSPSIPVGIISARKDKWLRPQYHSDAIIQACARCQHLDDIKNGGHGALLSPLPPDRSGLLSELIDDPPGFNRTIEIPEINRRIASFFKRILLEDMTQ